MAQKKARLPPPSLGRPWQLLLSVSVTCHRSLSPSSSLPVLYSAWGGLGARAPGSQPSSGQGGDTYMQWAAPLCSERGSSPTQRDKPQLPSTRRAAQGVGSRNRGGFMPKKLTAGTAAPRRSAQTLFPFYLGKHETAEPRGQVAPCQQQHPAPSRTPRDRKLTHTQRHLLLLLLLPGPLGAHPAGKPTHVRHCHLPSLVSSPARMSVPEHAGPLL